MPRKVHGLGSRSQPPPWWPEGEQWPPTNTLPMKRSRALRRRFVVMFLIVVVLLVAAVVIFNHAQGNWNRDWGPSEGEGGPPGDGFFWPPFALLAIGAIVFWLVRKIGRTFAPLAQIIDAADRVAGGDYSVRVNGSGPPEIRGMAQAFNIMTARLEVNEEQRKHLLSDIAHELRTPLAVVQGTIEGMIDDVYPKDTAHLAPLLDQTQMIARLLNDLQTVATAEAGVLGLHRTPTSLGDLVNDTATSFAPAASRKEVTLTTDVIDRVELEIDPVRIRQVLDNLLTNALRYTDAGGSIVIGFRKAGSEAEITVRDSGRGMPPEEAARMFERFVKSADSGGSGLGLAIAKSLVEAHGGTISAQSAPGEGTTVTIRLPQSG
jgi:two-component system, OmpR family, sensor histidine kinase BaeS